MSLIAKNINRAELIKIIDQILKQIKIDGFSAKITIYGGAAMMYYQNNANRITQDIDAAFSPDIQILKIVKEMSKSNKWDLPENGLWFNNQIVYSEVLPRNSDKNATKYYTDDKITIQIASKEALLAMKAMSMSDRGRNKDIEDVQWLVNNLSVKNSEELMKIVRDHWSTKQLEHYPLDYVQKIWTQVIVF